MIFIYSCKEILNGWLSATNLTKFVKYFCEFGSKIKNLESIKLGTDDGNGIYLSARIYFVYILSRKGEKNERTVEVRLCSGYRSGRGKKK